MTAGEKVVLTRHDRKDRLGHGGIKAVAEEVGVDPALVSRVVNGKQRHAPTEEAITRRVVQAANEAAFPPRDGADEGADTAIRPSSMTGGGGGGRAD